MTVIVGDDVDPLIGRVFASRYKIESELGAGAMGTVYKARHVKVGRPFAVKMLHERLLLDDKLRKRFDREAELAGKLHHINVVGVVDVGETEDGIHFMVMEFADGVPLGSLVSGPMPAKRVIDLVSQLCDGLQHAHEHGLVHRDFKPDNVIVERDRFGTERPRIVDFGIAILRDDAAVPDRADRLTTAGLVLGTPHYMAPEHAMGGGIDHRIDLFALGVICYELLTGQLPYDGDGVDVARANLLIATPPMGVRVPGVIVDPLLEAFTRLLMQKDPANRPQSAKEARRLLDLIATDRSAAALALGVDPAAAAESSGMPPGSATSAALGSASPASASLTDASGPATTPPLHTPSTRAVTVPERGDAVAIGAEARRASTRPGEKPRAKTASGERGATRTPVVDERHATGETFPADRAPSEPGRDPRAGSEAGRNHRAASEPGRDPRADSEGGRNHRAASDPGRDPRAGSEAGRERRAGTEPGREPRAGSEAGRERRAGTEPGRDPRAGSEAGRERRATTVLPHPRRLIGIGIGVGLVVIVVLVVMIATRGGGSSGSAGKRSIDAAPEIAIAPIDVAPAPAIDAGVAPTTVADAALAVAGDAAGSPSVPVDATAVRVDPGGGKPKPPKLPRPPKPPKPPPPEKPVAFDTSASGVAQLYGAVGRELKALDVRKGSTATSALWPRYLRIRINDALATPEKRAEAHRALSTLRTKIAAQR